MRRTLRPIGRTSISTPGVERVVGLAHVEPALAAREERRDQRGEVLVHVGEGLGEGGHDLLVECAQDLLEFAARVAHVADLGVQVLVASLERGQLLERERVDRAEGRDAGLELGDPRLERDALGQVERRDRSHLVRLDAEVAADDLVDVGDLDDELGAARSRSDARPRPVPRAGRRPRGARGAPPRAAPRWRAWPRAVRGTSSPSPPGRRAPRRRRARRRAKPTQHVDGRTRGSGVGAPRPRARRCAPRGAARSRRVAAR